jgi:hypothetical protein
MYGLVCLIIGAIIAGCTFGEPVGWTVFFVGLGIGIMAAHTGAQDG